MQFLNRLGERAAAAPGWLHNKAQQLDANATVLAGRWNDQARRGGIERNLERLKHGSEEEVMQRLIAEHQIAPGSKLDKQTRARLSTTIGQGESREPLLRYADKLNRGPAGLTSRGLGEYASGVLMENPAARVAGVYAPATAIAAAGLSAAGQGLMGLIESRERAVHSLRELEQAAGMMIKEQEEEATARQQGRGG